MSANDLANWVNYEVEARGWSLSEAARRAGLSKMTLSLIARGERTEIERKTCEGLALAFEVSVDEVMIRAGLLPDRGEVLPEVRLWSDKLRAFSPADRARIIAMVDQLLELAAPRTLQNPEWRQLDA